MENIENTWECIDEFNMEELMGIYERVYNEFGEFENCVFYTFDELLKKFRTENAENVLFMLRIGGANISEDDYFQIINDGIYGADTWDIDEFLNENEKDLCEFLVELTEEQLNGLFGTDNIITEAVKQDKGME